MKILIYTFIPNMTKDLAIDLIPMGFEGIEISSKENALSIIQKDPTIPIFITENHDIDLIQKVKELSPKTFIFLLANEHFKPNDLMSLNKLDIKSIINVSENTGIMAEEIVNNVIFNHITITDKRAHVRITPKEFENILGAVYVKEMNKFIRGVVLNISAGGVAIRIDSHQDLEMLQLRKTYDPLLISLHGSQIKTLATLVGKRNEVAGFKFDNVESKGMKKIAAYIHGRVNENVSDMLKQVVPS